MRRTRPIEGSILQALEKILKRCVPLIFLVSIRHPEIENSNCIKSLLVSPHLESSLPSRKNRNFDEHRFTDWPSWRVQHKTPPLRPLRAHSSDVSRRSILRAMGFTHSPLLHSSTVKTWELRGLGTPNQVEHTRRDCSGSERRLRRGRTGQLRSRTTRRSGFRDHRRVRNPSSGPTRRYTSLQGPELRVDLAKLRLLPLFPL